MEINKCYFKSYQILGEDGSVTDKQKNAFFYLKEKTL